MARARRKPRADLRPDAQRVPPPSRPASPPDRLVAGLAAAGMAVTAYLSWAALSATPPAFCTEGAGCDLIQNSQWSRLLGVPVAVWGLLTYTLLLLLALVPQSRLRRWQRSLTVALAGVAISLYLTAAGVFGLQAVCGWCLLSLALILGIAIALMLRRPPSAPGSGGWRNWWLGQSLLAAVLLVGLHLYWSGLLTPRADPRLQALAGHLQDSGAKFYGAFWCPNCREQKALFGGAADALPYVECHPNGRQGGIAFECVQADIRAYPTWVIRGRSYEEVLSPDELARRSGFRWQNPPAAE